MRRAIILIALTLTACSTAPVAPATAAPCETAGLRVARSEDRSARLAAAFVASAADVASWRSNGYGNGASRIQTFAAPAAPLDRVDVCWYEGAFSIGGQPSATAGRTIRPQDRLLVLVDPGGVARIAGAGFRETMPIASPPHGP
ncbi:MAG TPA: hypothetical protein VGT60_10720 [Candidatus Limnocylindria bacterium]|nr:hypothetical protein [Candidatus Limnocylindria bacterium]